MRLIPGTGWETRLPFPMPCPHPPEPEHHHLIPRHAVRRRGRVCIVNNDGSVLMDKFVRPKERITDFRTRYR